MSMIPHIVSGGNLLCGNSNRNGTATYNSVSFWRKSQFLTQKSAARLYLEIRGRFLHFRKLIVAVCWA